MPAGGSGEPELVGPPAQRSRQERVAVEAVADDRVEPGAQPRCAGRGDRDGHEGAGNENGRRARVRASVRAKQVDDGRQAGVEGGLLDQHRDPGQHTRPDET